MNRVMVNTGYKMSDEMLIALTAYEAHCFFTKKESATYEEVTEWLSTNGYAHLVDQYEDKFLWIYEPDEV
mgnify:CR=1 FL=1